MTAPHRDAGFFTETLATRDAELFGVDHVRTWPSAR